MARYSVENRMPAALPACQGLLPTSRLDAACSEARFALPACTSAMVMLARMNYSVLASYCGEAVNRGAAPCSLSFSM